MANRFFSHKVTPANFLFVCRRVCMLWKSAKGSQIDRWEDGEMGIYIAAVRHRDREMSIWNVNVIRSLSGYKLTTMLTTVNRSSPHTDRHTQTETRSRVIVVTHAAIARRANTPCPSDAGILCFICQCESRFQFFPLFCFVCSDMLLSLSLYPSLSLFLSLSTSPPLIHFCLFLVAFHLKNTTRNKLPSAQNRRQNSLLSSAPTRLDAARLGSTWLRLARV